MKHIIRPGQAFFFFLLTTILWAGQEFLPFRDKKLSTPFNKILNVSIVNMIDSKFSEEQIDQHLEKTVSILSQCHISLNVKERIDYEWIYGSLKLFQDLDDYPENRYFDGAYELSYQIPIKNRPLIVFIHSFDDYVSTLATAVTEGRAKDKEGPLKNTVWITSKIYKERYLKQRPSDYNEIAHELVHLLTNDTHVYSSEKNLMHYKLEMLSGKLTDSQCKQIRQSPLVKTF